MSDGAAITRASTVGAPAASTSPASQGARTATDGARRRRRLPRPRGDVRLALICLALAALTIALPSTLTYDPWAWVGWGREITHLDLSTLEGPSWKPLPVLLTTPFSVFGVDIAPKLWLVVARAGGLFALVVAFRLTARLVGRDERLGGRVPALLGGAVAALGVFAIDAFARTTALGNSEGILVALLLLTVERHLDGRRTTAFVLLAVAGLLRPEVWLFLAVYGLVLLIRTPPARPAVLIAGVVLPVLWFGPELWGSGKLLRSATRAADPRPDSPAFEEHPWIAVLDEGRTMLTAPLRVAALVAIAAALVLLIRRGRDRAVLALAGLAIGWVGIVAGMTEAGYAGNKRYLIAGVAAACLVGGIGVGRLAQGAAGLARRLGAGTRAAAVTAGVTGLVLIGVSIAPADPEISALGKDVTRLGSEADVYGQLDDVLERVGGTSEVLRCGMPYTGNFQVPALAYRLGLHANQVGFIVAEPGILFRSHPALGAMVILPRDPERFQPITAMAHWNVAARCRSATKHMRLEARRRARAEAAR